MYSRTTSHSFRSLLITGALVCASWFAPQTLAATIDLELLATPAAGSTRYDATIRNNSAVALTLVSILNAPISGVSNLTAPPGFLANFDPGTATRPGIINFQENTRVFAPMTSVSGFSFNSLVLAGANIFTMFEAYDIQGTRFAGRIAFPQAPTGVPDSGSTIFLAAMATAALAAARRLMFSR